MKQREQLARQNLGEAPEVDANCELLDTEEGLQVYADYSVILHMQDLEFTVGKVQDRSIKMQLLERADNKKWFVWSQQGMIT